MQINRPLTPTQRQRVMILRARSAPKTTARGWPDWPHWETLLWIALAGFFVGLVI